MTINIGSNGKSRWAILSNFPPAPFEIDEVQCASTEGAIQAVKFKDPEMQRHVCTLVGRKAKFKGKKANKRVKRTGMVWWQGREIPFRSKEHFKLIERFLRAKFTQYRPARRALLATGNATFTHNLGHRESPHTSFPVAVFTRILCRIRTELQKEEVKNC